MGRRPGCWSLESVTQRLWVALRVGWDVTSGQTALGAETPWEKEAAGGVTISQLTAAGSAGW